MSLIEYINNTENIKLKIDFPSLCNANCIGCYTNAYRKNPKKRLSIPTLKNLIITSSEVGIKQLVIAADGEPLLDLNYFFHTIEYATNQGIETIVYTNGSLITKEVSKMLFSLNVSLFCKRNTFDHKKQNMLLNANLSRDMMDGVGNLLESGFDCKRLAIESFVSSYNKEDLVDVLLYCRKNNIFPYFEDFIVIDQEEDVLNRMKLSCTELDDVFLGLQRYDRALGFDVSVYKKSRRYGLRDCSFEKLLSVDTDGNIKHCIFNKIYGNVYRDNIAEIFPIIPSSCQGCTHLDTGN